MISDPADTILEGRPWIGNPIGYVQKKSVKLFGCEPAMTIRQLSVTPPLFECNHIVNLPDKPELKVVGMATSKREAERLSCIQLCQIIDEIDRKEIRRFNELAEIALKAVPSEHASSSWASSPKNECITLLRKLNQEPVLKTEALELGSDFIVTTECSSLNFIGVGMAKNKKEAARLSAIELYLKLLPGFPSDTNSIRKLNSSPINPSRENIASVDCIPTDFEKYSGMSWFKNPKADLNNYSLQRFGALVNYEAQKLEVEKQPLFIVTASFPGYAGPSGEGVARSIKDASKFAAMDLIVRTGLFGTPQTKDSKQVEIEKPSASNDDANESHANILRLSLEEKRPFSSHGETAPKIPLNTDVKLEEQVLSTPYQECRPKQVPIKMEINCGTLSPSEPVTVNYGVLRTANIVVEESTLPHVEVPAIPQQLEDTVSQMQGSSQNKYRAEERISITQSPKKAKVTKLCGTVAPQDDRMSQIQVQKSPDVADWRENIVPVIQNESLMSVIKDKSVVEMVKRLGLELPEITCMFGLPPNVPGGQKLYWTAQCTWNLSKDIKLDIISAACRKKKDALQDFCLKFVKNAKPELRKIIHSGAHDRMFDKSKNKVVNIEANREMTSKMMKESEIRSKSESLYDRPLIRLQVPHDYLNSLGDWFGEPKNEKRLISIAQALTNPMSRVEPVVAESLSSSVSSDILERKSLLMLKDLSSYLSSPDGRVVTLFRGRLLISKSFESITTALARNQIVILAGSAGTGKSTQVPNLILDQMTLNGFGAQCNVLVTQPRRIAAISLAERVAGERGEPLGLRVGYQVRFDSRLPEPLGSITYCTTGILLQKLRHNPRLCGYSHIVLDEVHERDLQTDFLLILLRDLLTQRPELRLVIMSASMDVGLFSSYFAGFACIQLEVPVSNTKVSTFFLEDILDCLDERLVKAQDADVFIKSELSPNACDIEDGGVILNVSYSLIEALIGDICAKTDPSESILIFLPGWEEIVTLYRCLMEEDLLRMDYRNPHLFHIYLLHSQMRLNEQVGIFDVPPAGVRKIILATNIAESSITIEDVVHVIDSGKIKVSLFDSEVRIRDLSCQWITKANSIQRKGRAGRVTGVGSYYLLMSQRRFETLAPCQVPEMLRADLQDVCLLVKALSLPYSVSEALLKAINPPDSNSVMNAVKQLQLIGALDAAENLTPLGSIVSMLPLSPSLGKMVLYGMLMRCLDAVLIVASCMSVGSPFQNGPQSTALTGRPPLTGYGDYRDIYGRDAAESDHIAALNAYLDWRAERASFCSQDEEVQFTRKQGLSLSALLRIHQHRVQLQSVMEDCGLFEAYRGVFAQVTDLGKTPDALYSVLNENSRKVEILKAVILIGLFPNVANGQTKNHRRLYTVHQEPLLMHPSSINYKKANVNVTQHEDGTSMIDYINYVYEQKVKTSATFLINLTRCSSLSLFFFGTPTISGHDIMPAKSKAVPLRSLPKVLDWMVFGGISDASTWIRLKEASDASFLYAILRLDQRIHSQASSVSEAAALLPLKGQEDVGSDELIRFTDKMLRAIVTLMDQSG